MRAEGTTQQSKWQVLRYREKAPTTAASFEQPQGVDVQLRGCSRYFIGPRHGSEVERQYESSRSYESMAG